MATERIYFTDSYATRLVAQVGAHSDDRLRITLDRTIFYPTSGGQPHDLGTLNGIAVVAVSDEDDAIVHTLAAPLDASTVSGEIDWTRRYDHMQQHTGQHLLSAVFAELHGAGTLSFHMGDEVSTIELDSKQLTAAQMDEVVLRATELARANPPVTVSFENANEAAGLRKPSTRDGVLRVVEIRGIDRSACGGTHVAALAETLPLQIRDIDRVRGNVRVSFVCGNRAMRRAQNDFLTLSSIARSLNVALDQAEAQLGSLQQRLNDAEKRKQRLELDAAARAGVDLYQATQTGADGIRRAVVKVDLLDEPARAQARSFAAQPKAVLLMHSAESVLIACSPDAGLNAGAVLKEALAKAGARGGGSATLAQGSLPNASVLEELVKSTQQTA